MNLPNIGDEISPEYGIELCEGFGFNVLADRIYADIDGFKTWTFDGGQCGS